jgi:pyruvate kinase
MLESMVNSPTPTRAEVTDVANAIFDGTDAVMLSEETAMGKFPVECVRMLHKVALNAEERMRATQRLTKLENVRGATLNEAMGRAATAMSNELGAKAIVTSLDSMGAVSKISSLKPLAPIFVISSRNEELRRLQVVWGVYPLKLGGVGAGDMISATVGNLIRKKFLGGKEKSLLVCLEGNQAGRPSMGMRVLQTG